MTPLRVALRQCDGSPRDPAANLDLRAVAAIRAAAAGARLLVCPELFLTGYTAGAGRHRRSTACGPAW